MAHLADLIRLRLAAGARLQIQEARSTLKDYMAAFGRAHRVAEFRQQAAKIVEREVRVVPTVNELCEQLFCFAHGGGPSARAKLAVRPLSLHSVKSLL